MLISGVKSLKKGWKWTKKVENYWKKGIDLLSGARSTQELVKIHNNYDMNWIDFELITDSDQPPAIQIDYFIKSESISWK